MKPKHQRLLLILAGLCSLAVASVLILRTLNDTLVFFYSPTQLQTHNASETQRIRVGGLVEAGSVRHLAEPMEVTFTLTDKQHQLMVHYHGLLPNLFREGQGIVGSGFIKKDGVFYADELLAKHDETYMPPEVVDALKKSGEWKGGK